MLLVLSSRRETRLTTGLMLVCRFVFIFTPKIVLLIRPTVKKIRLRTMKSDTRIFREVNALSRLSHRFIVRYYTTWVETSQPHNNGHDSDSDSDSDSDFDSEDRDFDSDDDRTTDARTSVPSSREVTTSLDDGIIFALDDLDDPGNSRGSFPSIHFNRSTDSRRNDEDSGGSSSDDAEALEKMFEGLDVEGARNGNFDTPGRKQLAAASAPLIQRTLYIQMVGVVRPCPEEGIDCLFCRSSLSDRR